MLKPLLKLMTSANYAGIVGFFIALKEIKGEIIWTANK